MKLLNKLLNKPADPRLPVWLCIGVPKAGTTSLYHALQRHPDIWMPKSKETQFFCSPDYDKGLGYYVEQFYKDAPPDMSRGELSPKYLVHKRVPARIKKRLGDQVKFLVILRDPVERAWSHYCHSYKVFRTVPYRPTEDLNFEEALAQEPARLREPNEYGWTHGYWNAYFTSGLYAVHLKNWFQYFKEKSFFIMTLEDLVKDTVKTIDGICDHIGIDRLKDCPVFPSTNSYSLQGLQPETEKMLRDSYRPYTQELEKMLDRDLSGWY